MRKPYEFNSFGEVTIKGYQWIAQGPKKGIILLAHGMAETIERYDELASHLSQYGFMVYGHNHRGHGQTAGSLAGLGILGKDGWVKMKDDLRQAVQLAKANDPDLPVFIVGHSMGSFLLRDFLLRDSQQLQGAILCGTGFIPLKKLQQAKRLASIVCRLKGASYPSKLLHTLTFGKNNLGVSRPKTSMDWLTRDQERVSAYLKDPYCGQIHSAGFYRDFTQNLIRILYQGYFVHTHRRMPILLLSGKMDPVGDYGLGPIRTKDYYDAREFNTRLILYPEARHELFHELNREKVIQDLIDWVSPLT